jgi:hypothetical protein
MGTKFTYDNVLCLYYGLLLRGGGKFDFPPPRFSHPAAETPYFHPSMLYYNTVYNFKLNL